MIEIKKSHNKGVSSLAITPDGKKIVSGGYDGAIKIWDLETGKEVRTLLGHEERTTLLGKTDVITSVAITPDGKKIVSGGYDGAIKIWDLETGKEVRTLLGHDLVDDLSITYDGKSIVSVSDLDHIIKIWEIETGKEVRTFSINEMMIIKSVANTPDGKKIVTAGMIRSEENERMDRCVHKPVITVFDFENGNEIKTLLGHEWPVLSVAITPDGKKIVSGAQDDTIRIWDLETGKEVRTLLGHDFEIRTITITLDGKKIVSGGSDRTIRIWDFEKGNEIRTLSGHTSWISSVAITPDGKKIVSGSVDETIRIWDLEKKWWKL